MPSAEQTLLRLFRMMICDHRKNSNRTIDQILASLDDMETQSIKEQGVAKTANDDFRDPAVDVPAVVTELPK